MVDLLRTASQVRLRVVPSMLLVITGAAAAGKSTVGAHLRRRPGLCVIDGDVLGRGAAATADGRRDYVGFWRYVMSVCGEIRSNGLIPVVPCICLPDQVLGCRGEADLFRTTRPTGRAAAGAPTRCRRGR